MIINISSVYIFPFFLLCAILGTVLTGTVNCILYIVYIIRVLFPQIHWPIACGFSPIQNVSRTRPDP